jgi:Rps23 Pro-64 3,4-dihydroxylase Tpa1-like proline 4-hydroxylase
MVFIFAARGVSRGIPMASGGRIVAGDMIDRICDQLEKNRQVLSDDFARDRAPVKCRFTVLDHVLPESVAHEIHRAFPPVSQMRFQSTFREQKYTSRSVDKLDPVIGESLFAFQAPQVVEIVRQITGMKGLMADPTLYAGGISAMTKGQFLNPHLDNSHNSDRTCYRRLNLLYYATPDWSARRGGNLELWDTSVRRPTEIPSLFNRLVIMETNRRSWHSVNPVRHDAVRCCVSNYFFSRDSPEEYDYFHVTSFSARPEHRFERMRASVDNLVRSCVRFVKRDGLGPKDVYEKKAA